jgi:hypothetical protein
LSCKDCEDNFYTALCVLGFHLHLRISVNVESVLIQIKGFTSFSVVTQHSAIGLFSSEFNL